MKLTRILCLFGLHDFNANHIFPGGRWATCRRCGKANPRYRGRAALAGQGERAG